MLWFYRPSAILRPRFIRFPPTTIRRHMSAEISAHSSSANSGGSVSGFPEEDLRQGGENNPGYFPARLGHPLESGRFCIVRKLGWGQYSSVWLAKDEKKDRFVALKILTCEATNALEQTGDDQRSDELRLLEKIASAQPEHRGFKHNVTLYDSFEFIGPHGNHICLVTEALSITLDYIRKLDDGGDRRLSVAVTKRLAKQILYGLEYLHDVCGIIHTDVKFDNILFRPADLDAVVAHALLKDPSVSYDCGTDVCPPVVPIISQGLPSTTSGPICLEELNAVIADVGHSHWKDRHFQEIIQPSALRAPEVILGYPWNESADVWNFGCLMTELLTGSWLFEFAPNGSMWDAEEDHLARMTEALATRFDPAFLAKCRKGPKFFNADGSFAHFTTHEEPTWPLEKLLVTFAIHDAETDDLQATEKFLRRCLQLTPEKRATVKELIEDPWLADVQL